MLIRIFRQSLSLHLCRMFFNGRFIRLYFAVVVAFTCCNGEDFEDPVIARMRISNQAFTKVMPMIATGDKVLKQQYQNSSNGHRLFFAAGLEGSGHHAWQSLFKVCLSNGFCKENKLLSEGMMQFEFPEPYTIVHGLFGAADTSSSVEHFTYVYNQMVSLAETIHTPKLNIIGLLGTSRSGMMSYPNFNGIHKVLDFPDIQIMAAIAEAAKLDLRVLVLLRDPASILASVRRRMFGGSVEPRVLIANADALITQLNLLDRRFFYCLHYEDLGRLSDSNQTELLNFIHPGLRPFWKRMMTELNTTTTSMLRPPSSPSTLKDFNHEFHMKQMKVRLDLIAARCAEDH